MSSLELGPTLARLTFAAGAMLLAPGVVGCGAAEPGSETGEARGAVISPECEITARTEVDASGTVVGRGSVTCPAEHPYRLHVQLERLGDDGLWKRVTSSYGGKNAAANGLELAATLQGTACIAGETFRVQTTVFRPMSLAVPPEYWDREIVHSDTFVCAAATPATVPTAPSER